jgi:hypothetical protein
MITRTNHHLLLPTADIVSNATAEFRGAAGAISGSKRRRQDATKLLADATSMMDMTQLLSTHVGERGFDSICRHLPENPESNPYQGETVYSYVTEVSGFDDDKLEFRLNVTPGNPCTGTFKEFIVDFDSPESKYNILKNYP